MWNSEEPNEFIKLIQDEQQDALYRTFERSSLIVGLARWTKFFCYSFIILQLISIILEMLSPFAVSPPDLFTQLLFLTLVWVMVEVITIPVETISDITIIDYQKNWISLEQKRFFYRRSKVLASFNMIRSAGVSSRPPAIIPGLFSSTTSRYALVIQTYDDKIIHVTDHSLSLDDANELCEEFSRKLSGVNAVVGEPDMDLAISSDTRELVAVPCRRSFLTIADAASILSLKIITSFATSILLLYLSILIINSFASGVFTADLKINNQPGILLVFGSDRAVIHDVTPEAPSIVPETVELALNPNLPTVWQQSRDSDTQSHIVIDSGGQRISLAAATATKPIQVSSSEPTQPDTVTKAHKDTDDQDHSSVADQIDEVADPDEEKPETMQEEKLVDQLVKAVTQPETPQKIEITNMPSMPHQIIPSSVISPARELYYAPLNSRIPSVDMAAIIGSPTKRDTHTVMTAGIQPEVTPLPVEKVAPTPQQPTKSGSHLSILPGYGVEPIAIIGEAFLASNFGEPLFQYASRAGIQKFYENFTVLTDKNGIVNEVNVTNNINLEIKTPQNIGIGTPIKAISRQYGPFTTSNIPGIHYPRLGISFMPAVHNPGTVGAIRIYKPSGKLSEN